LNEVEILRAPDGALVRELALVLNSVGIPHRVVGNQHQQWILCPESHALTALEELSSYHREKTNLRPKEVLLPPRAGALTNALLWAVILAIFHVLSNAGAFGVSWPRAGAVDGSLIRAGELWRPFTALFLHGDLMHIVSNLAFGALFVVLLQQVLGATWCWTLVLFGGALGNLLNAAIAGPDLRSLGASTAVFAALGSLTAVQWSRKLKTGRDQAKRWIPLLAGVLLLGWNGMGRVTYNPFDGIQRPKDDNTDIGAHFAGFLCGILLGWLLWKAREKGLLNERLERIFAWVTPICALLAWGIALANA
jgi:rhomboid protease GluP